MTESIIKVRSKPVAPRRGSRSWFWIPVLAAVLIAAAATLAFDAYSGRIGIFGSRFEIVANGANHIIRVPPGGDLQAAIDRAVSGDIIELQAGAVYYGEIKLPNKPLTDFVTIQSSAIARLPADQRVGPAQIVSMAKILTRGGGKPAVYAGHGAHHYRLIGIEFAPNNADYIYNLVLFGFDETKPSELPHDLEIDRSYFHPYKSGVVRRGLALNSANTIIKNSYFEGFAFPGEETQGICGWTGTKNVKVLNNYIEAGAENIMFGGSDIAAVDLIPSDIEVRGNYLIKPTTWKGKVTLKTLFELKNAKRVQFVRNHLENNWFGSAFRITVRNETGGSPYNTIEDVLIKDNVINGAGEGINILGKDDSYPSQTLKRLTIVNNLFLNIGGGGFEGRGYFIQIADGENIMIANNTVFNTGDITRFYGVMPRGFVFRDNITGHGEYGVSYLDNTSLAAARALVQNNVFVNNRRLPTSGYSFPPGNTIVSEIGNVGFVNAVGKDFRLAPNSRFKDKGTNKADIGFDSKQVLNYPNLTPR